MGPSGRRVFVIVNPTAADGEVGERWGETSAMLGELLGDFGWELTRRRGHATALAREALDDGYDVVACIGGDGTTNETVNGFFRDGAPIRPGAALGVLPCGTGGDFKRTLKLSGDLREAALRLRDGAPTPCDVGHLSYIDHEGAPAERYFINIASAGISGLVDRMVNESSKALGGKLTFMVGTLRAWSEYEPPWLNLLVDGTTKAQVQVVNVVVANGRYFGGGMKIAPHASIKDGMLDIVIIRQMSVRQLVPTAYKIYEGRIGESPAVSQLQAREIYAEPVVPEEEVLLDVDGEAPGRLPATFKVLPGAIEIFDRQR